MTFPDLNLPLFWSVIVWNQNYTLLLFLIVLVFLFFLSDFLYVYMYLGLCYNKNCHVILHEPNRTVFCVPGNSLSCVV